MNEYKNDVYGVLADESWSNNYSFHDCRVLKDLDGGECVEKLVEQAEELRKALKAKAREIDNPVLTTSTLSALEFFIENIKDS